MQVIAKLSLCRIDFSADSATMEPRVTESFTIELSSNPSMSIYSDNTLASFRTALPAVVVLDGTWEVALSEVVYPSSFHNVVEGKFDFYRPPKKSGLKVVKSQRVGTKQRPKYFW